MSTLTSAKAKTITKRLIIKRVFNQNLIADREDPACRKKIEKVKKIIKQVDPQCIKEILLLDVEKNSKANNGDWDDLIYTGHTFHILVRSEIQIMSDDFYEKIREVLERDGWIVKGIVEYPGFSQLVPDGAVKFAHSDKNIKQFYLGL